jgi:hypothetical protein
MRWELGTKLRLVMQNFNGLKPDDTSNNVTSTMEKCDFGILIAQETWIHGKEREVESIIVTTHKCFSMALSNRSPGTSSSALALLSSFNNMIPMIFVLNCISLLNTFGSDLF